jgi:hypothetical protein
MAALTPAAVAAPELRRLVSDPGQSDVALPVFVKQSHSTPVPSAKAIDALRARLSEGRLVFSDRTLKALLDLCAPQHRPSADGAAAVSAGPAASEESGEDVFSTPAFGIQDETEYAALQQAEHRALFELWRDFRGEKVRAAAHTHTHTR